MVVGGASIGVDLLQGGRPATAIPPSASPRFSPPAFTPQPVSVLPAEDPANAVGDLHMVTASAGWARRISDGSILHTTAGVLRWTVASPPRAQVIAAAYLDAETARALTVASQVSAPVPDPTAVQSWATADGGAHWTAEGRLSVHGFSPTDAGEMIFVDGQHGWYSLAETAANTTALFRTVDGGASWSEVATTSSAAIGTQGNPGVIPDRCLALTATFLSASTGWMTGTCEGGGDPAFYVTHDGGVSWNQQPLGPLPAGAYDETSFSPVFTSPASGTVLTENLGLSAVTTSIFATADGGRSWTLRWEGLGQPAGADFLDPQRGWLVFEGVDGSAAAPAIYATGDGGATWAHLNAFPYSGLALDFVSAEIGWAAPSADQPGSGPSYLVETEDGGRTWTPVVPQVDAGDAG